MARYVERPLTARDIDSIENQVLLRRTFEYVTTYRERGRTNCSTFARFLFDGQFIESTTDNNHLSLDGELELYCGQELVDGDILCYLHNRKITLVGELFAFEELDKPRDVRNLFNMNDSNIITCDSIRKYYGKEDNFFTDFHFDIHLKRNGGKRVLVTRQFHFFPAHRRYGNEKCIGCFC